MQLTLLISGRDVVDVCEDVTVLSSVKLLMVLVVCTIGWAGVSFLDMEKVAAHLLTPHLFWQNSLEELLLKVTVIMLDLEIVVGGAKDPV